MNISFISTSIRNFFENRELKRKEKLWSIEQEDRANTSSAEYLVEQVNKKQELNTNTSSNKTQAKSNFVVRPPDPSSR